MHVPVWQSQSLINVPFSDAVASLDPSAFKAIWARSASCAFKKVREYESEQHQNMNVNINVKICISVSLDRRFRTNASVNMMSMRIRKNTSMNMSVSVNVSMIMSVSMTMDMNMREVGIDRLTRGHVGERESKGGDRSRNR